MSVIADCGFRSWGKWITRHWKTCGVFKRLKIAYKTIPVCLLAIRPSTRSKCKTTKERRPFFRVPNRWSSARGQLPRQFFACLLAVSWYQHRTAPLGARLGSLPGETNRHCPFRVREKKRETEKFPSKTHSGGNSHAGESTQFLERNEG